MRTPTPSRRISHWAPCTGGAAKWSAPSASIRICWRAPTLAPEHREQALLALAQDYLRAGLLDRAEGLFQQVSEVPRLRASALDALRWSTSGSMTGSRRWALFGSWRASRRRRRCNIAAHYLCELAALAIERGDTDGARRLLREARAAGLAVPARGAVARADRASATGRRSWRCACCGRRSTESPELLQEELPHLLDAGRARGPRDAVLAELVAQAECARFRRIEAPGVRGDRGGSGRRGAAARRRSKGCSRRTRRCRRCGGPDPAQYERTAHEIGALLAHAEKYRCSECGFSGRSFYWHCPACHSWDSFEAYAIVKLR